MPFTPVESTFGGILIGTSVIAHALLNGRVTGMSGALNEVFSWKLARKNHSLYMQKFMYVFGLIFAGHILNNIPLLRSVAFSTNYTNTRVEDFYSFLSYRYVLFPFAGLLVGFGTSMGSGCTSGHMICGVARLSLRSIIATTLFCGMALVLIRGWPRTITNIASGFGEDHESPFVTLPTWQTGVLIGGIFGALMIGYVLIFIVAYLVKKESQESQTEEKSKDHSSESTEVTSKGENEEDYSLSALIGLSHFYNALVFGFGLGFSGMTKPLKVLGFFDIAGPHWDISLLCVALCAILSSLIIFQILIRTKKSPILSPTLHFPNNTRITPALIIGALLFGAGWGLAGICPGPMVVNLANSGFQVEIWLFFACFLVGIFASDFTYRLFMKIKETIVPEKQ